MNFLKRLFLKTTKGKINLADELSGFYGSHRSGWGWAISNLKELHNPGGIRFDSFIERTFVWHPKGPRAHREPWIGFIHVPPNVPEWFQNNQSNQQVFKSKVFQESYPYCKGLFTLSNYHKRHLVNQLTIPVNSLLHPTETPELTWTWERFEKNPEKKIVQIGWYLRRIHSIFQLPPSMYTKVFLKITYFSIDPIMEQERTVLKSKGLFNDEMYETAKTIEFIPNEQYDELLAENLVFLDLYDSSANNAIIECMVRNTPILVNPHEGVREYLGDDYPFYYNSHEEAIAKAMDMDLVHQAHEFLKQHPNKHKLSGRYFCQSFKNSEIYCNL